MRNVLIFSVLALSALAAPGCIGRNCNLCSDGFRPGLFGRREQQQQQPCCQPTVVCCDPCAGVAAQPVMSAPVMGGAPCCQ